MHLNKFYSWKLITSRPVHIPLVCAAPASCRIYILAYKEDGGYGDVAAHAMQKKYVLDTPLWLSGLQVCGLCGCLRSTLCGPCSRKVQVAFESAFFLSLDRGRFFLVTVSSRFVSVRVSVSVPLAFCIVKRSLLLCHKNFTRNIRTKW